MIKLAYLFDKEVNAMNFKKYFQSKHDISYNEYIEKALNEAEEELQNPNIRFLTHEEIFEKLKNELNKK